MDPLTFSLFWVFGWVILLLVAWQLLLLTLIPLRLATTALGGRLAIGAGGLLKRRLLVGALKLEPDEIRHLGVGTELGEGEWRTVLTEAFTEPRRAYGIEMPLDALVSLVITFNEGIMLERAQGITTGHRELLTWIDEWLTGREER